MSTSELAQRVRDHVEQKIGGATIETSPFPHLVLRDFMPDDVYEKILSLNVFHVDEGRQWMDENRSRATGTNTPYYARRQINFHKDGVLDSLTGEHAAFWKELSSVFLADDWFPRLIIDAYRPYFDIRFGDAVDRNDFCQLFRRELFLQRRPLDRRASISATRQNIECVSAHPTRGYLAAHVGLGDQATIETLGQ